jgi:hypothetical protein
MLLHTRIRTKPMVKDSQLSSIFPRPNSQLHIMVDLSPRKGNEYISTRSLCDKDAFSELFANVTKTVHVLEPKHPSHGALQRLKEL